MPFDYQSLCNSWKWNLPHKFNIGTDCTDKHAANPHLTYKPALIWESGDGFVKTYTFSDLRQITNRIANALLSCGIKRKDRVVIILDNVAELPFAFVAALKVGAVPIPTSTMLTGDEVAYILLDSGAKAVVTSSDLYGRVEAVRGKPSKLQTVFITGGRTAPDCTDLDELAEKSSSELVPADTLSDEIAYICYTSGTTGEPKGVVHAHRCIIGRDPAAFFWVGVKSRPTVFHAGKLNWTYTLGAGCLDPWRHGCTSVIYGGKHDPVKMFEIIEKHKVNVFMAVPTVYRQMHRAAAGKSFNLPHLTHCLSAGEHLSRELFLSWKNDLGFSLYDGLGMSEFSYYISNMIGMEIKPGSPGKPQPGRNCFLADPETGERVADSNTAGVLSSTPDDPGIMLGYWNRPEETRRMFSLKGNFVSGDFFKSDEDGYLWPLGRKDDMINSFGYRISPFEVEAALSMHNRVKDCAVAGIKSGESKTIAAAFVVAHGGTDKLGEHLKVELEGFMKKRLAQYKVPKEIYFIDSIPRTKNGKKKRGDLHAIAIKDKGN